MKEIPTTLKVDSIGRVMIPKSIRDAYGIQAGDLITITIRVLLNPFSLKNSHPILAGVRTSDQKRC